MASPSTEESAPIAAPAKHSAAPFVYKTETVVETPGVTLRVVMLCLALAVIFGYLIPIIDVKLTNTYLGAAHLPPGALAVLLILLLVINPLLKLASKRIAFTRNEILTVYISCLFSCLVPGHGSENFFISNIIAPFYFSTPENKWMEFLHQYLKPWFTPAMSADGLYNKGVVEPWFVKLAEGQSIPWEAWFIPLAAWGSFVFASYVMLGCLSVMLRAQWSDREALTFPLLKLPLEMTEDVDAKGDTGYAGNFFRNPVMWIGFGLAVFVQVMNGLHVYYPDFPGMQLSLNTANLLSEAPWNQIGVTPVNIFPIVVGITYLLTSEVSFSLWFFYWFIKFQYILAYSLGFMTNSLPNALGHTGGAKTFTAYQQVGCYLAFAAIIAYTGREHFKHIAKRAFGLARKTEGERGEPLSYPVAFWGFVLSYTFVVGWTVLAGVRLDIAVILWLVYLVIAIGLSRVVVEGGLLFVQQGWAPLGTMAQLMGSGDGTWLAKSSIVPATFIQYAMMTDLRGFLLPSFIQSFKLARDRKINVRPLLALIFAVTLISFSISLYMNVRLGYEAGGLSLNSWFAVVGAQQPAVVSAKMLNGTRDVSWMNWVWMGVGGTLTYGMMLARSRFVWFPFHPLGFLMSATYPMNMLWFSIFLGWLLKSLIQRFGGSDAYRKLTPAFLGLALGDISMMLFWLLIDGWQGRTLHQLMPG